MMNKYKIIALFGPAGSGKDYIQKMVMRTIVGKMKFHEIISYTTRPPREGEIDGVHYHFLSSAQEFTEKELLEATTFRGWQYGTPLEALDQNKINIGVFNGQGIQQLMQCNYSDRIVCLPIYIKAYDKLRLIRQLNREIDPDCLEICRRFQADKEDFLNLPFSYYIIENNNYEIQPVLDDLFSIVKEAGWL